MARIFDVLMAAGTAMLCVRMFAAGLDRRYRLFFLFLVFETVRSGVFISLSQASGAYQKVWVLTEPVEWLLYVSVVLEIFARVLEDYKGLSTVGRWALIAAVVVALSASAISLMVPSQFTTQSHLMRYYYVAERAVYFSLVAFLVSMLAFLTRYPITLSRNIVVHCIVFSVYFLCNTVSYLLLSMLGKGSAPMVTYVLSAVTLAAIGVWLVKLTPAGEVRKLRVRHEWMPGREEELAGQLNSLNAALLRAARR
jgi:hypothetical protein